MEPALRYSTLFLCFIFFPLGCLLSAENEEDDSPWTVKTVNYRPYLTLESVKKNYAFSTLKKEGKTFELRNRSAVIRGKTGSQDLEINGMIYHLHYPPLERKGHILLSAYDVTNLLDLVFRAVSHMQSRWLRMAYIQSTENEKSVAPDASDMAVEIQQALSGYGLRADILKEEDQLELDEDGALVWLSLQGNGNLPERTLRTTVLAPPGAPSRVSGKNLDAIARDAQKAVHLGNLYDAESLALATLIHSGLTIGPGAKQSLVEDGGIHQSPRSPFQGASGASVHIEWGANVEPLHILKAVAAGLLRFRAFLDQETKRRKKVNDAERPVLKIQKVADHFDAEESKIDLDVSLAKTEFFQGEFDPEMIDVQVFVFTREGLTEVDLLVAPPPSVHWTGLFPDWTAEDPETLRLSYFVGKGEAARIRQQTFGHVVRVSYDGKHQTELARPQGLLNQLWRFTPIFP